MLEGIDLSMFSGLTERMQAPDLPTDSYKCPICRNTGWKELPDRSVTACPCQEAERARKIMELSGLSHVLDTLTFERYQATEPWQQNALENAKHWLDQTFSNGNQRPWLFMGGAVGSGKTHLCTAVCGELLGAGRAVRYMLWPEDSRAMKASVNDLEEFDCLIRPLKTVDVLYIDDLFKTQRERKQTSYRGETYRLTPQELISTADVRVAFELLDARYRMDRPTIISCEWLMDELMQIDDGLFSRVYDRSKLYTVQIARKDGRNMRLKQSPI